MQTLTRSWALYQLFSVNSGRSWMNTAIPATSGAMRAPFLVEAGDTLRVELTPHRRAPRSGTVYCYFQGQDEIGGVAAWCLYVVKFEVEEGSLATCRGEVRIIDGPFRNETVAFLLLARPKTRIVLGDDDDETHGADP